MKVLITGAGGQLGQDLLRVLAPRHECIGWTRQELDVTDRRLVQELTAQLRPDAIVHAAAYTQVDLAETHPDDAYMVNAFGACHMAQAAAAIDAKLVYVSTDYVFDGRKGEPYTEHDPTNPLSAYGESKLLGEKFVRAFCSKHFIVRTSWLYGKSGSNFVTKILALAEQRKELTVVDDEFGSPTYTYDLAECIGRLLPAERYGVYHAANRGWCSRAQFAEEIVRLGGWDDVRVVPIRSDQLALPAARPAHSALDDAALREAGLPRMREWQPALKAFVQDDLSYTKRKERDS